MTIRVCLAGATGWAGSALARAIAQSDTIELVAAVSRTQRRLLMIRLVEPAQRYKQALLDAASEMHAVGEWDVTPEMLAAQFDTILRDLAAAKDPATAPPGVVPYEDFWLMDDDTWIGLLTLRQQITPQLMRAGGHIGYVIRPSRRRQGYGTTILRLGLEEARKRGLPRVLLTCEAGNIGSRKVIEANGGRFENTEVNDQGMMMLRYWIALEH